MSNIDDFMTDYLYIVKFINVIKKDCATLSKVFPIFLDFSLIVLRKRPVPCHLFVREFMGHGNWLVAPPTRKEIISFAHGLKELKKNVRLN